jgi:pimeloyl-ACP methyl ester carboxylesterase
MIDGSILYKNRTAYDAAMAFYDSQLARVTMPHQTCYIETRHGSTHVLTAGTPDAPALVLWHGMNANLTSWAPQINFFAQQFYVIAADAVGNSGKSDPRRLDRKSLAYGEWSADVLAALNIQQAHHVGISGGGWMILKLANVAPHTIQSATLISSAGFKPITLKIIFKMLPHMLFNTPENSARRFLKIMSPPGYDIPESDIQGFAHLFNFKSERSIPVIPDDEIRCLTAPTMLLMGQYEVTFDPRSVIECAQQLIPNLVRAEIVAGVGHGMTGEKPDMINEKILNFIGSV